MAVQSLDWHMSCSSVQAAMERAFTPEESIGGYSL